MKTSMRKRKKVKIELIGFALRLQKLASTAIDFKVDAKRIASFFGMDKVPCSTDMQKSMEVLRAYATGGGTFTILKVNPDVALPKEFSLRFFPVIVVDPRQDPVIVKSILDSDLVKKHFILTENLSLEDLIQTVPRFI